MKQKVFSCMYSFVEEIPDSPLSVRLIASAGDCREEEVKLVFNELRAKGLLKRKHYFTHVYRLTPEGFEIVKKGWKEWNSKKEG